jgi:hypothetical protein
MGTLFRSYRDRINSCSNFSVVLFYSVYNRCALLVLQRGLLHNASYVDRFTRQDVASELSHSNVIRYYKNSQLVEQAIQKEYVNSLGMNENDHIGWCNDYVKVSLFLIRT